MSAIADVFRHFILTALDHPQGPAVARTFNRTLQFVLTDDEPFYVQIQDGHMEVHPGDSGLDWKYKDWARVTCVHASAQLLRQVIAGRRIMSDAFFDEELAFYPSRAADRNSDITVEGSIVPWLYALVRLALEQGQRTSYQAYVKELGA